MMVKTCEDLIKALSDMPKDATILTSVRVDTDKNAMATVNEVNLIDDTVVLLDTILVELHY